MAKQIDVAHDWKDHQWDWPLQHHDGIVKVINDKEHFEVAFEVHYFTPKEVQVSVQNNDLTVYCHHEERSDSHGNISRSVLRTYHMPADVNVATLKSQLTEKGVLVVKCGKK